MYEIRVVRERRPKYPAPRSVRDARAVADAFAEHFAPLDREHFVVLVLDGKNRVLGYHIVSVGSLTAALVHPREVFKAALLTNAAGLILVHNHPSGDPTPSPDDCWLVSRLRQAGDLLDVPLLDALIVTDPTAGGAYYSFHEAGALR